MIKSMEPKVVYENEEVLVLDKPAGRVVNRVATINWGLTNKKNTLYTDAV